MNPSNSEKLVQMETLTMIVGHVINSEEFMSNLKFAIACAVSDKVLECVEQQKQIIEDLLAENRELKKKTALAVEDARAKTYVRVFGRKKPPRDHMETVTTVFRHTDKGSCRVVTKTSDNADVTKSASVQLNKKVFFGCQNGSVKEGVSNTRKLLEYACDHFGYQKVWTFGDVIYAMYRGKIIKLTCEEDVDKILS